MIDAYIANRKVEHPLLSPASLRAQASKNRGGEQRNSCRGGAGNIVATLLSGIQDHGRLFFFRKKIAVVILIS